MSESVGVRRTHSIHLGWLYKRVIVVMDAPHKNALRRSQVKSDHFSVRESAELDRASTSIKIRILKGTHLLASDVMTKPPSSDPLIFGWCGVVDFVGKKESELEKEWGSPPVTECIECNENKGWDTNLDFRVSSCVKGTLNPTWDEEMLFDAGRVLYEYTEFERTLALKQKQEENKPMIENDENKENEAKVEVDVMAEPLDPTNILKLLMKLNVTLYVRDADPYYDCKEEEIPEDVAYDELGRVIIPLKDVIEKARYANGALVTNCVDYSIIKTPGMPALSYKVDLGSLTLGAQFVIGSDDAGKALKTYLGCPGPDSETGELTDKQLLKVLKEKTGKNAEKAVRARSASPSNRFTTSRLRSQSPAATPRSSVERPKTTGAIAISRLKRPLRSKSPNQIKNLALRTSSATIPSRAGAGEPAEALTAFQETEETSQAEEGAPGEGAAGEGAILDMVPSGGDESAPPLEDNPIE